MNPISTLIVDDESGAINTLRGMLEEHCPQIKIVGEATSVESAIKEASRLHPDLVFLDIEMPPAGTAFNFLDLTRQYNFGIIFATAHTQYAIKAINTIQPWAYLVKPFSIQSLLEAVMIAEIKLKKQVPQTFLSRNPNPPNIGVGPNKGMVFHDFRKGGIILIFENILYCKSDGPILEIYTIQNGGIDKIVTYSTLKDMESQLPATNFCRCHHSYIVNMRNIIRYELNKNTRIIYLSTGSEIPISIAKSEYFEKKMAAYLENL